MYIHELFCISPQQTNGPINLETLVSSKEGKLMAIEPPLDGVPPGMLRRMSKAVRMGIGAGLPLITNNAPDGIIIGTANGGMEDCIKFLNQIIDYDEGLLTPGNFVQSTPNAIAGQISLITKNRNYNATHVHLGLAFENALIDAQMFIKNAPGNNYLVGAVDEISTYNYNIDRLAGWYNVDSNNEQLYTTDAIGTIAGEGAAMFLVNGIANEALAKINAIETFHSTDESVVAERFSAFIQSNPFDKTRTVFISGENGDARFLPFYDRCETLLRNVPVLRYKHLTGEYPTAVSFAVWLACYAFLNKPLPKHLYKTSNSISENIDHIILYNQYHGVQHSFIYISRE